jgi:glutamate synthase domain-containing protein 2/glutamate synthase domain-containing protein 1/glutamate synthase domain-containing protein 3
MNLPPKSGLYDPQFERDACGIGLVAKLDGVPTHEIVRQGIDILVNLEHRGACGCDPLTGDGAGLLMQLPHEFFAKESQKLGFSLPKPGHYAVGFLFLPNDASERRRCEQIVEDKVLAAGQRVLGWRDIPVDPNSTGELARSSMPVLRQVFIGASDKVIAEKSANFERTLYVVRKAAENAVSASALKEKGSFYFTSLSSRTIVYKGLLLANQVSGFFKDLNDPTVKSALALVHQRFSTNTFPTWPLAQPFRLLCHNGEINTVRGNRAWMHAREQAFADSVFGEDSQNVLPVIAPNMSDSASLDNAVELLMHGGRSLPHVMMMLVPEAWQNDPHMPQHKKDFYEYHSCLMEPWDGPAALAFSDGRMIGSILDRNGLRPARWLVTKSGTVVLGSETGVLKFKPEEVVRRGRLEPGRMFLVDLEKGRIVEDEEIKNEISRAKPYGEWLKENRVRLDDLPEPNTRSSTHHDAPTASTLDEANELLARQRLFGYTLEDLRILLAPMAKTGAEAVGSMGTDTPLAILSDEPQLLYNYFKQHFAQVTNPPIDPIREELVMSLKTYIGAEGNLLNELPDQARMLELEHPILTNAALSKLRHSNLRHQRKPPTLSMLYKVKEGGAGLKHALDELCRQASIAIDEHHSFVILSDRGASEDLAPVPALLATAAVHHHLVRNGTRMQLGLIVETGEAREVHHFCLLLGYGAGAINPYLAFDSIDDMVQQGYQPGMTDAAVGKQKFIKAVTKGVLKVMSKMGISTLQSYRGAQIFECIGLAPDVVERYFTGTASRISGINLEVLAKETALRHHAAFPDRTVAPQSGNGERISQTPPLKVGGNYHYRAQGERHLWSPRAVGALQRAVRMEDAKSYEEYKNLINDQSDGQITLRGGWEIIESGPAFPPAIPLDQVEPASEIVKRFATGAMSFGSISAEAHENLAMAMNRIGGRSNTGEGGEKEERFYDDRRSSIKQVASGRFGVHTQYLVNADELQIKIAQGAKPGEGGQLPGHKVDAIIAKTRHSMPGVSLISPPPHHDIYSIEDLAQLIFDLKMVNPKARISVKLVAEAGVGTVAAGVAKAHADVILISGYDGGTGASPQTSIKHAGIPWELGLAETHQVLVMNDLRGRIVLQTDGQMRTGRDVVIAALLGAEEFGFATAPLVASGCILMRKCHLNTCPVGIATQDPVLRKKFEGKPEHVIRFMFYVAEEARALMAQLGYRRIVDMVGNSDRLRPRKQTGHWKVSTLDFSDVLQPAGRRHEVKVYKSSEQDHGIQHALDNELIRLCQPALDQRTPVKLEQKIDNINRTVGGMLAGEVARRVGRNPLADDTIQISFTGTAGQSFGAFMTEGMSFSLEGDANDYVGKGMAGGVISIRIPKVATYKADENILLGNVVMYGATAGKAFFNGVAGERFCVRNSGATAVVEGVGDHGCEYMTGGRVVVIGRTGRNFAAGMSGGVAHILDEDGRFKDRCNHEMVELGPLGDEDAEAVLALLKEHQSRTGSVKAASLIADWAATRAKMITVMPVEYRKVLEQQARERESLDERRAPLRPSAAS